MALLSLLDFKFTGLCSQSTAFLLVATSNEQEQGLTFSDTLALSENLFGVQDIGVILNQDEFNLLSSLNNILQLEQFWLGLEFNGEEFLAEAEVLEGRQSNAGFSFINDQFNDQSFFENLEKAPWNGEVLPNIQSQIGEGGDLSDFNKVVFQKTFEIDDDSDSDYSYFSFFYYFFGNPFGDEDEDEDEDVPLSDTWNIIDESVNIPGFLFREESSPRCYSKDTPFNIGLVNEKLLIAPFNSNSPNFAEALLLCEDFGSILIDFSSTEELNFVRSSLLFEVDPFSVSEYWTGITINSTNDLDTLAEKFGFIDDFENLNLEESDFKDSQVYGLVLRRIFGRVVLQFSLIDDSTDKTGAICRQNNTNLNASSNNTALVLIFIVGFLLILLILIVVFNKKANRRSFQAEPSDVKEGIDKPTVIVNSKPSIPNKFVVDNQPEDVFSILSTTLSDMPSIRSIGAISTMSVDSVHSKKTEISAADTSNDLRIKSIISDRSQFSIMSRRLLTIEPFIKNINNESELLSFYDKVDSFFSAQIMQDETREETNQSFMEFDSVKVPNISISIYVSRLVNGMNLWFNDEGIELDEFVGIRSLLLSIHLIRKANVDHPITNYNIHKLLSIAMLVAAKFVEDEIITNDFWADMAGITFEEVNSLEQIFCFDLDFNFDIEEAAITESLRTLQLTQLL